MYGIELRGFCTISINQISNANDVEMLLINGVRKNIPIAAAIAITGFSFVDSNKIIFFYNLYILLHFIFLFLIKF